MTERLASGPQLWTLNKQGCLAVVYQSEPLKADAAHELVAAIKADDAEPESLESAEVGS